MTHHELMLGITGLAAIGLLVLLAGARRRARNAALAAEEAVRSVSLVGRVLIGAALITGAELAAVRFGHNNVTLLAGCFAVPALLAAATVVKALTVTTTTPNRRGYRR